MIMKKLYLAVENYSPVLTVGFDDHRFYLICHNFLISIKDNLPFPLNFQVTNPTVSDVNPSPFDLQLDKIKALKQPNFMLSDSEGMNVSPAYKYNINHFLQANNALNLAGIETNGFSLCQPAIGVVRFDFTGEIKAMIVIRR